MSKEANGRYSPKQIEKYKRQKYISQLEKITKNLFRMFRDKNTTAKSFSKKLSELVEKLDSLDHIRLDTEYLKESENYIRRIFKDISENDFNDDRLNKIREPEMSILNRLQKMKNRNSYKKDKHKYHSIKDGWE